MVSKYKSTGDFKKGQISCYECNVIGIDVKVTIYYRVLEIEHTTQKKTKTRQITAYYKTACSDSHFGARIVKNG